MDPTRAIEIVRQLADGVDPATGERYAYDALGRMAWFSDGSGTNHLVYDGPHVIAEVDEEGELLQS